MKEGEGTPEPASKFRLPDRAQWLLMRAPETLIPRTAEPTILDLREAVEWVKREQPILWTGSVFSMPDPSNFPSGAALTRSLLHIALGAVPELEALVEAAASQWPLEALLDEFESFGYNLAESLLGFFNELNASARPNPLHASVVTYYERGFAKQPLCITTNWDTLQERAFRLAGHLVMVGGPAEMPLKEFGRPSAAKTISIYHPHGSFETKDVICSFRQQQQQLTLPPDFMHKPTLFLGYSGYEPSLYMHLEHASPQLWCVRDMEDLKHPAKRRLLCRPNVSVFVGDLRQLLAGLGVLSESVDLPNYGVTPSHRIPDEVCEAVALSIASSLNPNFCAREFKLQSDGWGTDATSYRNCVILTRGLVNHARNRVPPAILLDALEHRARMGDSEQAWISLLAYLLRIRPTMHSEAIAQIMENAEQAGKTASKLTRTEESFVYSTGVLLTRSKTYKSFIQREQKTEASPLFLGALTAGDLAALGEAVEMLAFEYLRDANFSSASGCFDYAATAFYLRGLWNAGLHNEWAAANVERLAAATEEASLAIPMQVP
jgi:hypothetical protein